MAQGIAVVTGAAGGLGRALCARLRAGGYEVVGCDLAGADRVLDVTDPEACRALADEVAPSLWVNNAGVGSAGDALDQDDARIERTVAVNLLGVIHGTRAAAAGMRARGHGQILNVASLAAWTAAPGQAVYSATKHGVRAFSVAVAAELRGTGVSVHVLCPDGIDTPLLDGAFDDPSRAFSFTGRRLLEPDEVAIAAARLLERGGVIASVPHRRGISTRLLGILPSVALRLAPMARRKALRGQARARAARR